MPSLAPLLGQSLCLRPRRAHSSRTAALRCRACAPPRLILLRHGEAVESSGPDHQRSLSERGREGVRRLARLLSSSGAAPQHGPLLVLCSDTVRSRETVEVLAQEEPLIRHADTRFLASLYTFSCLDGETAQHLREVIRSVVCDDAGEPRQRFACVLCVGHNKGWEEAASELSRGAVSLAPANAAVLDAPEGTGWPQALALEESAHAWRLAQVLSPEP